MNHSLELERTIKEFNDTLDTVKALPCGDLRTAKLVRLDKSKNFILHADRMFRDGLPIMDLIEMARENIQAVLDMRENRDPIIPRPPLTQKELWEQLDLPFNQNQK